MSLREKSTLKLKSPRIEANEAPQIGDIVQLKEDLPRGSWKLGKIVKFITSSDGNIRAAKVLLSTKNTLNRSLNLLYPLECERERCQGEEAPKTEITDANIKDYEKENDKSMDASSARQTIRTIRTSFLDNPLEEPLKMPEIEYSETI